MCAACGIRVRAGQRCLNSRIDFRWIARLVRPCAADDLLPVLRDDENSRRVGQINVHTKVVVRLNGLCQRAVRVYHKGHRLAVSLQPNLREALQVILARDRRLRLEDVAAVLVGELWADLVLDVAGADRSLERPDMSREGKIVSHQGNVGAFGCIEFDWVGISAARTPKVLKDDNSDLAPSRRLQRTQITKYVRRIRTKGLSPQSERRKQESESCELRLSLHVISHGSPPFTAAIISAQLRPTAQQ